MGRERLVVDLALGGAFAADRALSRGSTASKSRWEDVAVEPAAAASPRPMLAPARPAPPQPAAERKGWLQLSTAAFLSASLAAACIGLGLHQPPQTALMFPAIESPRTLVAARPAIQAPIQVAAPAAVPALFGADEAAAPAAAPDGLMPYDAAEAPAESPVVAAAEAPQAQPEDVQPAAEANTPGQPWWASRPRLQKVPSLVDIVDAGAVTAGGLQLSRIGRSPSRLAAPGFAPARMNASSASRGCGGRCRR